MTTLNVEVGTITPRRLNHYALPTRDIAATHRFWTEVMGCEFKGALRMSGHPMSTGEDAPAYVHTFYALSDGSCIAFFELAREYDIREDGWPAWTKHIAMSAATHQELRDWQEHLRRHGVEFAGEVDHGGMFFSIYFFDPNGQRLEITYQPNPMTDVDRDMGLQVLESWSQDKAAGTLNE